MSIIVAVRRSNRIVMAADSLTCFGESDQIPEANCRTKKILRIADSLIGGTGWAVYDNMLLDYAKQCSEVSLHGPNEIFTFFMSFWRALHDQYSLVNDQAASKDTPFGDLDSTFLIANTAGLFRVSADMGVCEFNRYAAIGSGSPYATGVLEYLDHQDVPDATMARTACEVAIALDLYCGESIDVEVVVDVVPVGYTESQP
jgi:ATP-dependent protease HslVU (ClpYQ) peptidase subunit